MKPLVSLLLFVALAACSEAPSDGRPALEDGWIRFEENDLPIAAAGESLWCTFFTLPSDGAIADARHWTDSTMLHAEHILVRVAPDDVPYVDGETVPCEELDVWWSSGAPLYEATGGDANGGLGLPEGVAFPIAAGTRFVMDSHFINASEDASEGDVIIDMKLVGVEDYEWAAGTISLDIGESLSVPPGPYTASFDCQWQDEATLLTIGGHMHEEGVSYRLDWIPVVGEPSILVDVPEWDRAFTTHPEKEGLEPGAVRVARGDVFRTTCTWNNRTSQDLGFPREMCTTVGSGYSLPGGVVCEDGIIFRPDANFNPMGDAVIQGRVSVEEGLGGARSGALFFVLRHAPPEEDPGQTTVASAEVGDVDLSGMGATVSYSIDGFQPRDEPYVLTVVLAADGELEPGGPESGDLVASGPEGAPLWVSVPSDEPVAFDIVLNSVIP